MAKHGVSQSWSGFSLPHAPCTFFFPVQSWLTALSKYELLLCYGEMFVKNRTGNWNSLLHSFLNWFLNFKLPGIKKSSFNQRKTKSRGKLVNHNNDYYPTIVKKKTPNPPKYYKNHWNFFSLALVTNALFIADITWICILSCNQLLCGFVSFLVPSPQNRTFLVANLGINDVLTYSCSLRRRRKQLSLDKDGSPKKQVSEVRSKMLLHVRQLSIVRRWLNWLWPSGRIQHTLCCQRWRNSDASCVELGWSSAESWVELGHILWWSGQKQGTGPFDWVTVSLAVFAF